MLGNNGYTTYKEGLPEKREVDSLCRTRIVDAFFSFVQTPLFADVFVSIGYVCPVTVDPHIYKCIHIYIHLYICI